MAKHRTNLLLKMDSLKLVLNTHTKFAQVAQPNKFKIKLKYGYSATVSNSEKFLNNSDNCPTLEPCSSKTIEIQTKSL